MTAPDPPSPSPGGPVRWRSFLRRYEPPVIAEFVWRAVVFLVALVILVTIATRWNRWQGGARWQVTDDAYLQSDLTPISAKVAGYVRAVPVQDFQRVRA